MVCSKVLAVAVSWCRVPAGGSHTSSLHQQEVGQEGHVCQAGAQMPVLPWYNLQPADWCAALLTLLDGMSPSRGRMLCNQVSIKLTADQDRAAMAASLWQLLGSRGLQEEVRSCVVQQLSTDHCPWSCFGAMQQLLTEAVPGKVSWLLQHQLLPELPQDWQLAPATVQGLQTMLAFSLKHGQHRAAAGLWQLAQQLQVEVPACQLVQGCLDGGVWRAAAAQDLAALRQLVAFGEYSQQLRTAARLALECVILDEFDDSCTQLLYVLSCIWNTAVLLDASGLVRLLGLPLEHHLRQTAIAFAPMLPHCMQALDAKAVLQLFGTVCSSQHAQHHGPQGDVAVQQFTQQLQYTLDHPLRVSVELCLQQMCGEWVRWLSGGPHRLVLPGGSSLASMELGMFLVWSQSAKSVVAKALPELVKQLQLLPPAGVSAAADAAPAGTNAGESSTAAPPAASADPCQGSAGSVVDGTKGGTPLTEVLAGSNPGLMYSLVVTRDLAQHCKARRVVATGRRSIMPLWQLAGMALATPDANDQGYKVDPDVVLEAALQPVMPTAATPAFLAGVAGYDVSLCGPTRQAGIPACPSEHQLVRFVLEIAQWHATWRNTEHRLDALAWALHPQQAPVWASPTSRWLVSTFIVSIISMLGTYRHYEPLLVQQHEQEVRQHRQQRAAGVTQGFGPLPHFAAAAADAASTLLAEEQSVYLDNLARCLSGCRSFAMFEHVKAMFAANLATPVEQLPAQHDGQGCQPVSATAVRKVAETGDVDLFTLVALYDLRMWGLIGEERDAA